jgi:hypothetical protein
MSFHFRNVADSSPLFRLVERPSQCLQRTIGIREEFGGLDAVARNLIQLHSGDGCRFQKPPGVAVVWFCLGTGLQTPLGR